MDVQQLLSTINFDLIASYVTRAAGGLLFLFFGFMVAGWAKRLVRRAFEARKFDATLGGFISSMVRYAILAMVVLSCLSLFGIETTSFAAILGAAGLAVGLALQGTLGNLAAGLLLVGFRPFKIGDFIKTNGEAGTVEEITLFTTVLRTPDNRTIIVPNGPVFNSSLENVSAKPVRRVDVDVGVDYSADIDKTREVLATVWEGLPEVLGEGQAPANPTAILTGLGASSVDYQLRVWCKASDYWGLREKLLERSKKALDGAGIGIPFPQMDVHLIKEG
ncbi:MAG: mechanosensitive ion channel domain-containing protein [Myxococcota bacterium]